jgi:Protein of unknown function (DUF1493)
MNNEIFERLKQFIVKERWEYDFPITEETTIEGDLRIYGDDSDEFLIAFGKEFNVDVSRFPIGNYFSGEGGQMLQEIKRGITGKTKAEKKILTVGHLEKAIIAGRLDEEVINS